MSGKRRQTEKVSYMIEHLSETDLVRKETVLDLRFIMHGLFEMERLIDGLYLLITEKWPVLGSKVILDVNGSIKLQRPSTFAHDPCPPFLFCAYDATDNVPLHACFHRLPDIGSLPCEKIYNFRRTLEMKPGAYELVKRRDLTSTKAKQCDAHRFKSSIRQTLQQLIESNGPLLTVEVFSFSHSNESVIRLMLPHLIFDAVNVSAFLLAWSDVINGHADRVPKVISLKEMQLSLANQGYTEFRQLSLRKHLETLPVGFRLADWYFILIYTITTFWRFIIVPLLRLRKPQSPIKVLVWIPQQKVDDWREKATKEQEGLINFLSENDVCLAWAVGQMASKRRSWVDGKLSIGLIADLRSNYKPFSHVLKDPKHLALSRSSALLADQAVFLHNAISPIRIGEYRWRDVSRMPSWTIAMHTRRALHEARKEGDWVGHHHRQPFDAVGCVRQAEQSKKEKMVLPFTPWSEYCVATNWLQADPLHCFQLTGALVGQSLYNERIPPPNSWAANTAIGHASEMMEVSEPRLTFTSSISIISKRRSSGLFMSLNIDPMYFESGLFGENVKVS